MSGIVPDMEFSESCESPETDTVRGGCYRTWLQARSPMEKVDFLMLALSLSSHP